MTGRRRMYPVLLALLICRSAVLVAADWPMWRHGANRGAASPEALPAELHLQWTRELPPPRPAFPHYPRLLFDGSYEPVVMGKTIFVPSMVTDSVAALDTETGAERWTFFADGPVRFAPVAWRGKVYFVSDDGHLYCVDAATGRLLWKVRGAPADRVGRKVLGNERLISRWPARGGPVLANGTVYFAAGVWPFEGVYVHAVDAETGKPAWTNADCGRIKGGLIDHGTRRDGGLSPQGYLTVAGGKLIVPSGRALPAVLDAKSGKMEPYTTGWGGRVALAKGSWYAAAIRDYFFMSGEMYGLSPQAAAVPSPQPQPELMGLEELAKATDVPLKTVQQWAEKGLLPTVERDGKRLARLYKPRSTTFLSWWTMPFRGGEGHVAQAHRRLQLDPANSKELGEPREPVLTPEAIYYSRPVNAGRAGSYRPVGTGYGGIVAYDIANPKWGVTCTHGYDRGSRIITWRTLKFDQLWRSPSRLKVHIKAGPRLYAGGPGTVAAVDIPAGGAEPKVSWQAQIKGTPARMLAADGKLLVVTANGRLYCFGGSKVQPRTHAVAAPPAPPLDEWTRRAGQILKQTGAAKGYCVALGVGSGRLVEELARQGGPHVVAIEPDAGRADAARRRLHAVGLYGARVHVLPGELASAQLPPYMASLVVSENLAGTGFEKGKAFVAGLFDVLRPYGGVACLPIPQAEHAPFAAWVQDAKLAGAKVERVGGLTLLTRAGALPGSADWTHESADAGNTFTSRDQRVRTPLGVLWFGGAVDAIFPTWDYTHAAYPSPLVVEGRMFIQVGDTLHAADIYTGRRLWEAALPRLTTKRTGHNYAACDDGVYVACDQTCLRLDPATGAKLGEIKLPAALTATKPMTWREIRLWRDCLLGASGNWLVCVDRLSGEARWKVQCAKHLASFAAGGGKVFCADCPLPDRKKKVAKAEGLLMALDARTGKPLWRRPLEVQGGQRVRPQLVYCDRSDVLLAADQTVRAYSGKDGTPLWQKAVAGRRPLMLHRDRLITQEGVLIDPRSGEPMSVRLWKGTPNRVTRGCNHAYGGEQRG